MKTKELIAQLQKADPSGELPVCVGNVDIYFVELMGAYYDGHLQQLIHDESLKGKSFSIIGAQVIAQGNKVCIHPYSIEDGIFDDPDFPVEFVGGSENSIESYKITFEKWRKESRETEKRMEELRIMKIKIDRKDICKKAIELLGGQEKVQTAIMEAIKETIKNKDLTNYLKHKAEVILSRGKISHDEFHSFAFGLDLYLNKIFAPLLDSAINYEEWTAYMKEQGAGVAMETMDKIDNVETFIFLAALNGLEG